MTPGWVRARDGEVSDGYVAWEVLTETPPTPGQRRLVPVFVQLKPPPLGQLSLADAITGTLSLADVVFSQHERDLLETERALALAPGGSDWTTDVRLVVWCARAMLGQVPPYWRVLQVGPSVLMGAATPPPPPLSGKVLRAPNSQNDGPPVCAVIDDGIAFLNTRFRRDRARSRFAAVWLQATERLGLDEGAGPDDVVCGRVLTGPAIDALITTGGDEAQVYRQINRALLPRAERAPTSGAVAHGTHVLDLAAGANPWDGEAISAVPLLAVQLPPAAIHDTSGRRMETYLVQGLRWCLAEVLRRAAGGPVPPVVINLSIGSLAGPGDETAFLADWMRHELRRHNRMAPGAEVRIVCAYGNARRARLVARAALRRAAGLSLDWRLLPDDHTPSFLELRVDAGKTRGLRLTLTPPPGSGLPVLDTAWPMAGEAMRLETAGGFVAAVSSVAEGDQALLHLAIAPSAGPGPVQVAPPGLWRVTLTTHEAEPVRVTARVQRDDTPAGYRSLGRQSWLDHPEGWDWDEDSRDYTAPQAGDRARACPVTREGTAVAFAGADHPSILFVGAARPVTGGGGAMEASPYSSSGAGWLARPDETHGPTLAARGDDGAVLGGVLAAGVVSGSVARLSGTSMAAPQVTRRLIRYFQTTPPAARSRRAERGALFGTVPPHAEVDPLLGQGVLAD